MKKKIVFVLCILLLVAIGGALGATEQQSGDGYDLYFMQRNLQNAAGESALMAESIQVPELENKTLNQKVQLLMEALLAGPTDPTLENTIPKGTTLIGVDVTGSHARIDLSEAYANLSGMELTLADSAITMTLTQLPEVLTVRVLVNGQDLAYRSKQILYQQEILLEPPGDVVSTIDVALYFPNERSALVKEERTLELYEGDTQVSAVIWALENGPEDKSLSPVFPETFRIRSVWLEEDVCYVNLLSAMLGAFSKTAELEVTIRALGQSLCSLETVSEVHFLVDGTFSQYYGSVYVADPYIA